MSAICCISIASRPARLALAVGIALIVSPSLVRAEDVGALQSQIDALQKQVDALKAAQAKGATGKADAVAPLPAASHKPGEVFANSAVTVRLGGFIENAALWRSRFQGTDVNSNWNLKNGGGMPVPASPDYHTGEFHDTARQSRLSILAQGQGAFSSLAGYYEMDFLGGGAGTAGNYTESNSFALRNRLLYATWDAPRDGWHLLVGQSWSLLTLDRKGITPRSEVAPLTIDAQYVPGFTWTRNPQIRLVKDFGKTWWVGLSAESPATAVAGATAAAPATCSGYNGAYLNGCVAYNSGGGSNNSSTVTFNHAPDVVLKVATDQPFGHYELYGVARFFDDRTMAADGMGGANHTTFGGGVGAAAIIPVIPKRLEVQLSGLVGRGIGRYGAAQLADVTIDPDTGKLTPIGEVQALLGVIGHPNDRLVLYGYVGLEEAQATNAVTAGGTKFGYGNADLVSYATCEVEGASGGAGGGSCGAQAAAVRQATLGAWYDAYKGNYGALRLGLQYSYTTVKPFALPSVDDNIVMASIRYYPF